MMIRAVARASSKAITRSGSRSIPALHLRPPTSMISHVQHFFGKAAGKEQPSTVAHYVTTPGAGTTAQETMTADGKRLPPGLTDNVWGMQDQSQNYPSLSQDVQADVVVVGAGIVGLSIAYNLLKNGKSVVVLESRTRGSGQTGRTSAHIMQWVDDYYSEVESKFGKENSKLVADSHLAAIQFHEEIVQNEGIECNFSRVPGYLFPHEDTKKAHQELQEELEACQRAGMSDVEMVDLKGDPKYGSIRSAIVFKRSAEFHPLMYINGLAEAIAKKGGKIYEFTRVSDTLTPATDKLQTDTGYFAQAREAIVYATNSPINRNVPGIHSRQEPDRTYMLGLKVPKGSVAHASFWDTNEPYHYVRIEPKDDHDVLLIGGEDHHVGQHPDKYEDVYTKLEMWAREKWTMAGEVCYRWSGMVYEPVDLLGMYGEDPLNPLNAISNVKSYIATADSGQGMTGSAIAAMVITDQIVGRQSPWTDLYSPSRLATTLASPVELGQNVAATVTSYAELVTPRSVSDVVGLFNPKSQDDLQPGQGAVVQEGLQKLAIYKDEQGKVHKCSAVCPHVGCLVDYNPMEKTFDCPCHGSQFDRYGHVINGPAASDLKKVEW